MISLCTFVKDEAHCIEHMFKSIINYVDEIVVVDTGSTDATITIAKAYDARIYRVGFTDFASIRTITAHLAREPWVLMLDADETISHPDKLRELGTKYECEAYAFPRKRWLDLDMTQQTEPEAYPDWQVRMFKNNTDYVWQRHLHEFFHGGVVTHIENGPILNHFQDVFKDEERNKTRKKLYRELAKKVVCAPEEEALFRQHK